MRQAKQAEGKSLRFTVTQVPVTYDEESHGYVLDVTDVPADQQWKVLDFTETWQNESGILTVVISDG